MPYSTLNTAEYESILGRRFLAEIKYLEMVDKMTSVTLFCISNRAKMFTNLFEQ